MLRVMRGLPSLQRRFIYIVFAFGLVFLVYLLTNTSEANLPSKREVQGSADLGRGGSKLLDAIKPVSKTTNSQKPAIEVPDRDKASVKLPDKPVDNPDRGGDEIVVDNLPGGGGGGGGDGDQPVQPLQPQQPVEPDVKPAGQDGIAHMTHKDNNQQQNKVNTEEVKKPAAGHDPYSGPQNPQQEAIVEAFLHAWRAYKKFAWGHDELKPISRGWQEWFGGIGLTIVDSLDTIYIMGLKEEFQEGRDWVAKNLTFHRDTDAQLFEIVIRELGGLLSAYHLSGDNIFLEKARDLADRLYPCFGGKTKVPCNRINLKSGRPSFVDISTAESGTIQLEFRDLSRSVGVPRYENAIDGVSAHLHSLNKLDGLVACFLNPHTGDFRMSSAVSAGASADSYYEYLIKQWIQTGRSKDWLKQDYLEAVNGIRKHLLRHSEPNKLAFVGSYSSMIGKHFRTEMEHLACFLPGMLALGYMAGVGDSEHLKMAEELTHTCYQMYQHMPTKLSPEVAYMNLNPNGREDISVSGGAHHNLQRPEAVESIFYMYRATKDPKYRKWGWDIFQAFEKHTRVENGYASIDNVKRPERVGYRDKMETFYLAETLKYLYLLFSDDPDLIPLDKFVINTEAHPLPVYSS